MDSNSFSAVNPLSLFEPAIHTQALSTGQVDASIRLSDTIARFAIPPTPQAVREMKEQHVWASLNPSESGIDTLLFYERIDTDEDEPAEFVCGGGYRINGLMVVIKK